MKCIFTILLIALMVQVKAQKTDSLIEILPTLQKEEKVSALLQLAEEFAEDSLPLALEYTQKAYQLSGKIKDKLLIADATFQLGKMLNKKNLIDSADVYLTQAEKIYLNLNNTGKINEVKYFNARYLHDNNQLDSAIILYNQVLDYARKHWDEPKLADILQQTAQCHFLQSKYNRVIEYLEEKQQIVESMGDSLELASTFNDISTSYRRLGKYEQAIEYTQKAIPVFQKLDNEIGVAECFSSMGSVYYYMDDNDQAIDYFIKSLAIFEKHERIDRVAALNNNIGSVYVENEDFAHAKTYFEKALKLYSSMDHHYAEAIISDNLGLVYLGLNNPKKALEYFQQSYDMQELIGNTEGVIHAMTNIAGLYNKQKMFIKAEELYYEALDMAIENDYSNEQLNIYKELIDLEEDLGNYKKALNTMRHYHALKDTLINRESRTQLNEMQAKLDLVEHQNQIKLLSKENELGQEKMARQQLYIAAAIIIIVLVVILAIIVMIALRFSRRAKRKLEWQNHQISEQRNEIQMHNKRMTDSIQYARRVQTALFAPPDNLSAYFKEYFILSKPHSIVSGDFYWFKPVKNSLYIALADCTGHGVPGAFMSMLGNALLNEIIDGSQLIEVNEVLNELRNKIKTSLHQTDMQGNTDGMDISLCLIDFEDEKLSFSGAYNPAYVLSSGEVSELKADKMPVAISRKERPFTSQEVTLKKGDRVYLTTDGFYDQFGGEDYSKITRVRFKEILVKNHHLPMQEQSDLLNEYFENWKKDIEQTDDMMVLGVVI